MWWIRGYALLPPPLRRRGTERPKAMLSPSQLLSLASSHLPTQVEATMPIATPTQQ